MTSNAEINKADDNGKIIGIHKIPPNNFDIQLFPMAVFNSFNSFIHRNRGKKCRYFWQIAKRASKRYKKLQRVKETRLT